MAKYWSRVGFLGLERQVYGVRRLGFIVAGPFCEPMFIFSLSDYVEV